MGTNLYSRKVYWRNWLYKEKKLSTVYKKNWLNSFSSWDFLLLFHMSELVLMQRKESAKNSLMNSHSTFSFRWWKTSFKIQKSCFPNGNAESRKPVMFSKVGLVYQSCLEMMIANFFFHWHGMFNTSDTVLTFISE